MYALETSQFNQQMLLNFLAAEASRIGKAMGLAVILASKTNFREDNDFGPRGTVNHLTIRKMAEALQCSVSTVHDHLAQLRDAGIIGSEPITDEKGAVRYCRLWFTGFLGWLRKRIAGPIEASASPSGPSVGGGSEKPETNLNNNNQKFIDLDEPKSVKFSEIEDLIRNANPTLSSGDRADSQMVYEKFRAYNLRKGTKRIALTALIGFAKRFTDFQRPKPVTRQTAATAPANVVQASKPAPKPDEDPAKSVLRSMVKSDMFQAWFERLEFQRLNGALIVTAHTNFVKSYVEQHFDTMISAAAGQGVVVHYR